MDEVGLTRAIVEAARLARRNIKNAQLASEANLAPMRTPMVPAQGLQTCADISRSLQAKAEERMESQVGKARKYS